MAKQQKKENILTELEKAYEDVLLQKSYTLKNILKEITILKQAQLARQVEKESASTEPSISTGSIDMLQTEAEIIPKVQDHLSNLQEALIKQESLTTCTIDAVHSTQIQNAFERTLSKLEDGGNTDIELSLRRSMKNYQESVLLSSKISKAIDENNLGEQELIALQQKYAQTLNDTSTKWATIISNKPSESVLKDETYAKLQGRLEARESRLSILKSLLQVLIAGSGVPFHGNSRLAQALIVCEAHNSGKTDIEDSLKDLRDSRSKLSKAKKL